MEKREQQNTGAIDKPITLTNIIELVNHGWGVSIHPPNGTLPMVITVILKEPVTEAHISLLISADHLKAYRFMGDHSIDTMFRDAVFDLMRQRDVITANNQDQ